jgi:hypothetical protein
LKTVGKFAKIPMWNRSEGGLLPSDESSRCHPNRGNSCFEDRRTSVLI